MKRAWSVVYRHRRGHYYAIDLQCQGQMVATMQVDIPYDRRDLMNAAVPTAFNEMVNLQPSTGKGVRG